jgi:benzoylformate decarboxylase
MPMDDWTEPVAEEGEITAPVELRRPDASEDEAGARLVALINEAQSPVVVARASAGDEASWTALVRLAERLCWPVYQEAFGARADFPQDRPQFVGDLPMGRVVARDALAPYDFIVVVGTSAFRQGSTPTSRSCPTEHGSL